MADIIVTKSDGTTDVTYKLHNQVGMQKNYANESAGLIESELLRVQHFLRPQGAKGTDRHQVVFQKTVVEDATNQNLVLSLSVQFSIPRSTDITLAMVKDQVAQMTSYLCKTANVTSLFNGATPEGDYNVTGPFNPSIA